MISQYIVLKKVSYGGVRGFFYGERLLRTEVREGEWIVLADNCNLPFFWVDFFTSFIVSAECA
jgi:hypothetical protein